MDMQAPSTVGVVDTAGLCAVMEALAFAASAHANQRRKGAAQEPYVNHVIEVASLVCTATRGEDPVAVMAALLHDAIEDTGTSEAQISERFGHEVARIVVENSDDMRLSKEERRRIRLEAAAHKSPRARLVKTADLISNLRAMGKSPPAGWGADRQLGYLGSCRALYAAMPDPHPGLAPVFAATAEEAEAVIRARQDQVRSTVETAARLNTQVGQSVHLVYVPNTEDGEMGEAEIDRFCTCAARQFPSVVVQLAEAIYDGIRRTILIARIRTDETAEVVSLAQALCIEFRQRFIGIEIDGRYVRVYADDTA